MGNQDATAGQILRSLSLNGRHQSTKGSCHIWRKWILQRALSFRRHKLVSFAKILISIFSFPPRLLEPEWDATLQFKRVLEESQGKTGEMAASNNIIVGFTILWGPLNMFPLFWAIFSQFHARLKASGAGGAGKRKDVSGSKRVGFVHSEMLINNFLYITYLKWEIFAPSETVFNTFHRHRVLLPSSSLLFLQRPLPKQYEQIGSVLQYKVFCRRTSQE